MKLMDIDADSLGIPDTEYEARVTMQSSELTRIVRDLSQLGESVRIEVSKEGVRFAAEGEAANGSVLLKQTEAARRKYEDYGKDKQPKKEEDEDDEAEGSDNKKKVKANGKAKVKKEANDDAEMADGDEADNEDKDEFKAKSEDEGDGEEEQEGADSDEESENRKKRKRAQAKVCLVSNSDTRLCDRPQPL